MLTNHYTLLQKESSAAILLRIDQTERQRRNFLKYSEVELTSDKASYRP